MTYFALFPPALKSRGLKLAVVFDYGAVRFRIWLTAQIEQAVASFLGDIVPFLESHDRIS